MKEIIYPEELIFETGYSNKNRVAVKLGGNIMNIDEELDKAGKEVWSAVYSLANPTRSVMDSALSSYWSAANSARVAAISAAYSAAYSAANSAVYSAEEAAYSAIWSVFLAADSAAELEEKQRQVEMIKAIL